MELKSSHQWTLFDALVGGVIEEVSGDIVVDAEPSSRLRLRVRLSSGEVVNAFVESDDEDGLSFVVIGADLSEKRA